MVTLPDDSSAASVREHLGVTTLRVLLPFLRRLAAVLLSSGKYLIVIAPLHTLSSVTPGWEQGQFQSWWNPSGDLVVRSRVTGDTVDASSLGPFLASAHPASVFLPVDAFVAWERAVVTVL